MSHFFDPSGGVFCFFQNSCQKIGSKYLEKESTPTPALGAMPKDAKKCHLKTSSGLGSFSHDRIHSR